MASDGDLGRRVAGRYRITGRIGRGGMATVYRAWDEQLGRDVALKVFQHERTSAQDLQRQQAEVRLLARLTHPSLVTLYDVVSDDDGRAVLVLEFVQGSDLRARLAGGPLPEQAVAGIGRDIAHALAHLHSRGIIHRDVSPGNILLPRRKPDDHNVDAKLTDLGIARLVDDSQITTTGTIIGTADYLSPEQAQGILLTPATDIYSLGLVLLECCTGERAFSGPAMESALARISRDPAIPEHLGTGWRDLLTAMTRRDPAQRPSAASVAERLSPGGGLSASPEPSAGAGTESDHDAGTIPMPFSITASAEAIPPPPQHGGTEATRVLTADTAGSSERSPRRRLSPSERVIALAGVAAVALAAVLIVLFSTSPQAPQPEATLPAVPGKLGDHLKQLQRDVSRTQAP